MGKAVNSCCCCIELRTGSLIIGYLSLIGYIFYIIDVMRTIGAIRDKDIIIDNEEFFVVTLLLAIGIMVFNVIFTLVLLYGLHGEKPGHVKAYLIYSVIMLVFEIIGRIYITVKLQTKELETTMYVTLAIGTLLEIYFLLVIQSQYFEMINPTTQTDVHHIPANYNSPTTYNLAINSHPVNGPAVYPAINSHSGNGPTVNPTINSQPGNIPANYSHPVNSHSMNPAVNNHANY